MKQSLFTVFSNRLLTPDARQPVCEMVLEGDLTPAPGAVNRPGQFVNVRLDGLFLRRPISVCDMDEAAGRLTLVYKVVGEGTAQMRDMVPGQTLDLLTGLGNGYNLSVSGEHPLLLGGGVGVPPLYGLAKRLLAAGRQVTAVLGYNRASDIFLAEELHALGVTVRLLTADGSAGTCGLVTDGMEGVNYTHLYTCGPEAMLHAVWQRCRTDGQFSFEERMGCGFGACMGCTCRTKYGHKRICKDGPVLRKEEIVW